MDIIPENLTARVVILGHVGSVKGVERQAGSVAASETPPLFNRTASH
ncbi:MAG: hypothetical protein U0401_35200 [Anaerolineae bacterium]